MGSKSKKNFFGKKNLESEENEVRGKVIDDSPSGNEFSKEKENNKYIHQNLHGNEQKIKCDADQKNDSEKKIEELTNDLKRVQAEFENYQKRIEKEFSLRDERMRASILLQSLTVLDALNAGIKHDPKNEGLVKVKEVMVKFLHDNGVRKMTKKEGDQFDHEEMDCLMQGNDSKRKDGEVLEVLQKGYFINNKVLRFAKVKVNKINSEEEKNLQDEKKSSDEKSCK
jgi:molecular chaperone GrpE